MGEENETPTIDSPSSMFDGEGKDSFEGANGDDTMPYPPTRSLHHSVKLEILHILNEERSREG
jgi:hypothetical protein